MTRSDIHRPAAVEPTDYRFVDAYELSDREGNDCAVFGKDVDALDAQGLRIADHLASSNWSGVCGTCGQRGLTYVALMVHRVTGEYMVVGSTCISSTFESARLSLDAKQAAAAQARKEAKLLKAFNDAVAAEPVLAAAVAKLEMLRAMGGTFEWRKSAHTLQDIVSKCRRYGNGLSERQAGFVTKLMTWIDEDIARAAKWAAERAAQQAVATDAPTGRTIVTGEIVGAKWHDNGFDTTLKITVLSDEGYRVWCSIPSSMKYIGEMFTEPKDVRGKRITMTVTLAPSEDDATFAFGTRPAKAEFVA